MTTQPLGRALGLQSARTRRLPYRMGCFVEVPLGPQGDKVIGVVGAAGKGDYELSKIRFCDPGDIRMPLPPCAKKLRSFLTSSLRLYRLVTAELPAMCGFGDAAPRVGDRAASIAQNPTGALGEGEPEPHDRCRSSRARDIGGIWRPFRSRSRNWPRMFGGDGGPRDQRAVTPRRGALNSEPARAICRSCAWTRSLPHKELKDDQASPRCCLRRGVGARGKWRHHVALPAVVTGSGQNRKSISAEARGRALSPAGRPLVLLGPKIATLTRHYSSCTGAGGGFGRRSLPRGWHSGAQRQSVAGMLENGGAGFPRLQVVIGALIGAVFCRFRSLGLIVVDEEHEQALSSTSKKKGGRCNNARDMAVLRRVDLRGRKWCFGLGLRLSLEKLGQCREGKCW